MLQCRFYEAQGFCGQFYNQQEKFVCKKFGDTNIYNGTQALTDDIFEMKNGSNGLSNYRPLQRTIGARFYDLENIILD